MSGGTMAWVANIGVHSGKQARVAMSGGTVAWVTNIGVHSGKQTRGEAMDMLAVVVFAD
jgi:hypothetical protein